MLDLERHFQNKKTAGNTLLPAVLIFKERIPLPVPAAVEAATTMETAAAVEFTSTANRTASSITVRHCGTASVAYAGMCVPTTTPTFATPAAATPEFCRVTPVVPRASADEDATDKVAGTIEAIRRASVGIVIIISVRARRRPCSEIPGSDSDPHPDSNLRL